MCYGNYGYYDDIPYRHSERHRIIPFGYYENNRLFQGQEFSDSALDILKQRYAKGEITEEDFLKMKKNIED